MQARLVPHEGLIEQLYHLHNFPRVDIPRGGWPSKASAGFLRHEHTLSLEDACCKAFYSLNRQLRICGPLATTRRTHESVCAPRSLAPITQESRAYR
jgi:hypothetical protein